MSIFKKIINKKQAAVLPANKPLQPQNSKDLPTNKPSQPQNTKDLQSNNKEEARKRAHDLAEKITTGNYLDINIGDADAIRIAVPMAKNGERVAIGALGVFGDSSAVDPLIHILQHGSADSRQDAANALGCIGDPKGIDAIIDALKHEYIGDRAPGVVYRGATTTVNMSKYVRYNMIIALGRFGDKKALEILRKALNDHEESIQVAARWAIDYIGASYPKSTITHEITAPVDADVPALIETLKNISEYDLISNAEPPATLKFYQNSSFILRRRHVYRAIRALKRLGPSALDPLVQAEALKHC